MAINFDNQEYISAILHIAYGVPVTLKYAIISALFGIIIGILICALRLSGIKILRYFALFYISIIRGVPLLLQLSIVYFALPQLLNIQISAFLAGIIAFSLNSGGYVAEIIRSGLTAIDKGQFEAADSLGLSRLQKYYYIIYPQVLKNTLPALLNELIALIKESSIISIIGELDITRLSNLVSSEYYTYFSPLLFASLLYYVIVVILTYITEKIERYLRRYD